MDPITPTASTSPVTGQGNVQAAVSELGSDVFLRLLVTQLQSQDPTNPVENEDFVAQLAQFTTLEQATNTNELLGDLVAQDTQRTELGLVNLIGRTVISEGDTLSVGKEEQPILGYALSADASFVTTEIFGQNGQIVRKIESNVFQNAGANQVQWDGLDHNGDRVEEGIYRFRVSAEDAQKNSISVLPFAREQVANIVLGAEKPVVVQSGRTLNTQDIISIQ